MMFAGVAQAQTATTAVMPILYTSSGAPANTNGGTLAPGYYFLAPGGEQVYYYGNGTYYNPTTMTYGGSAGDPTGAAGTYTVSAVSGTPGLQVPNTGAGGNALATYLTLAAALMVAGVGVVYLSRNHAVLG